MGLKVRCPYCDKINRRDDCVSGLWRQCFFCNREIRMVEDGPFRRWTSALSFFGSLVILFGIGIIGVAFLFYPEGVFWITGVCVTAAGVLILGLPDIFASGGPSSIGERPDPPDMGG